jgi:hypothetical protein
VINTATIVCFTQEEETIDASDSATTKVTEPGIEIVKICAEFVDEDGLDKIEFAWEVTNTSPDMASTLFSVETTGFITCPDGTEIVPFGPDVNDIGALAFGPDGMIGDSFVIDGSECPQATGDFRNDIDVVGEDQLGNEYTFEADVTCNIPQGGENGCTPGFWKNNAKNWDYAAWPAGTFEDVPFSDVFDRVITIDGKKKTTITDPTLEQALAATGGGINALARHGVAAYLNSIDAEVAFPISTSSVISWVQEAIDTGDFEEHKSILADANELGCSQNQKGEPIDPE